MVTEDTSAGDHAKGEEGPEQNPARSSNVRAGPPEQEEEN